MNPGTYPNNEEDHAALRAVILFCDRRLAERGTIDWATRLKEQDAIKRKAIRQLLEGPEARKLAEPWKSAWRLIEESWSTPDIEPDSGVGAYRIRQRLRSGERSGALIGAIVALVAPRLKVEPLSELRVRISPPPKRARKIADLFTLGLRSGRLLDLNVVQVHDINEPSFLASLAFQLESAVTNGIDIGLRIGGDSRGHLHLGQLHRVYYVPAAERAGGDDPDKFVVGIAPSVKLLHAVVERLLAVDLNTGLGFVRRWRSSGSPVYQRLWAAMARDPRNATADDIAEFLNSLDTRTFWDLVRYPEVSELRARRFEDLTHEDQASILARIRRRPPRNQWLRSAQPADVERFRTKWAVRELRRLEIAGVTLPAKDKAWLDSQLAAFPDVAAMTQLNEGFSEGFVVRWAGASADATYDAISGRSRLEALEAAISSPRSAWDDDPAERAQAWIQQPGHALQLLEDFDAAAENVGAYPKVWELFGWAHSPQQSNKLPVRDLPTEALRVIGLISRLPTEILQQSIDGLAHWYASWKSQLASIPASFPVWLRLWDIAAEKTNTQGRVDETIDLSTMAPTTDDDRPTEIDTINTSIGKLVDGFLATCPSLRVDPQPFVSNGPLRTMRDKIISTTGHAGLIGRLELIEQIGYFLNADRDWTQEKLIAPLLAETTEALSLWQAISRRLVPNSVLKSIGNAMSERVTDKRLPRESREMFVFNLVIESLHSFQQHRDPAVANARIQQMLRSVEDEVRSSGAEAIRRFVIDSSMNAPDRATAYRQAAAPFLAKVWPLEISLITAGVSRSFANLPVVTGDAFVEAVDAVERYIEPWDGWSMIDFGFGTDEDLSSIDTPAKADALLRLLDRSIGPSEGAAIPMDLSTALERIRTVAPRLAEDARFRRLATAARRL